MKAARKITLFALGLVILAGLAGVAPAFNPLPELEILAEAASENIRFDVACDCRTGVAGPNRGDVFIIQGKIFDKAGLRSRVTTVVGVDYGF